MKNPEMEQKSAKKFLDLKIIAFESGTTNSHNREQDTCHCQSMFCEQPLRLNISLRKKFSKSGSLRAMKKYDGSSLMQILEEFGSL